MSSISKPTRKRKLRTLDVEDTELQIPLSFKPLYQKLRAKFDGRNQSKQFIELVRGCCSVMSVLKTIDDAQMQLRGLKLTATLDQLEALLTIVHKHANAAADEERRARVDCAQAVQADVEAVLTWGMEGREKWSMMSWAALMPSCFLRAILARHLSPACLNFRDVDGLTALHVAAGYNSVERVRMLLEEGAEVDAAATGGNMEGQTPLLYALGKDECCGELVATLIRYGADVLHCDAHGFAGLHWCVPQHGCK
jgi:Ankyrin repeats (3 copies)